jgi:hypothetical protein
MYDVGGIFGKAYNQTANIEKANSGFRSTGLWPLNELIFTDEDFSAAQLTDEPEPQSLEETSEQFNDVASDGPTTGGSELAATASPEQDEVANVMPMTNSDAVRGLLNSVAGSDRSSSNADDDRPRSVIPHPGLSEALQIINELSPIPKIQTARVRKRKAESAELLTSSPFKKQLEDKVALKQKKTQKKKTQKAQKTKRASSKNKTQEDNTPCIICSRRYNEPPSDTWTQCKTCRGWYHDSCGPDDVDLCYNCVN